MKGAEHTCIVPNQPEVDRIRAYCEERGIDTSRLTFHVQPSERVLPGLDARPLDARPHRRLALVPAGLHRLVLHRPRAEDRRPSARRRRARLDRPGAARLPGRRARVDDGRRARAGARRSSARTPRSIPTAVDRPALRDEARRASAATVARQTASMLRHGHGGDAAAPGPRAACGASGPSSSRSARVISRMSSSKLVSRLPAEHALGLGGVADEVVDLGRAHERRVDLDVAAPSRPGRPRRRRPRRTRAPSCRCSSR